MLEAVTAVALFSGTGMWREREAKCEDFKKTKHYCKETLASKTVLTLKHNSYTCSAFAHPDLRRYLERGRQSPRNIFKGLKTDFAVKLLKYTFPFILDWADLNLIDFHQ